MLPGARNATFNWVCAEAWRPWGTLPGKPPDDAVDGAERRQIQAELEIVLAELAVAAAEMDGLVEAEPPF